MIIAVLSFAALAAPLPATTSQATTLSLCSNPGSPPAALQHLMVVMLENQAYTSVIGSGSKTPYENGYLASSCGLATEMHGATHSSAANYLALTGGQYPPKSPSGCGSVSTCASSAANLFSQLDATGQRWTSYEESMPYACDNTSATPYKIGHNPALFYGLSDCKAYDIPVSVLAGTSGGLYDDLGNQTLPAFAFVTPNLNHDGAATGALASDTWLKSFLTMVGSTPAYQAGTLAIVVTYDEGLGWDSTIGEDCTNQTLDLAGKQPSCHIAAFVVYPWASGVDSTFFTHYSVTRTVEDLFGLAAIYNAGTATSLLGHMGLPR